MRRYIAALALAVLFPAVSLAQGVRYPIPLGKLGAQVPPAQVGLEAPPVGEVTVIVGTATVRARGLPFEAALSEHDIVREGVTVRTLAGSRLRIRLLDGSTLSLGEATELRLDQLARERGGASRTSVFTLFEGYLRTVVAPLRPDSPFQVQTPSMVAAVRGTEWIQRHRNLKTELLVENGSVVVQESPSDLPGQTRPPPPLLMHPGEGVGWGPLGVLEPIRQWVQPRILQFLDATFLPLQRP